MRRFIEGLGLNIGLYVFRGKQWALLAVLPALLIAAVGYVHTGHQKAVYEATATLYVAQPATSITGGATGTDPNASSQLAGNYSQMITYPTVAKRADGLLATHYPGFRVEHDTISSSQQIGTQSSQLFSVTVKDASRKRAIDATNAVATAFIGEVKALEQSRFAADERSLQAQLATVQSDIGTLTGKLDTYKGDINGRQTLQTQLSVAQSTRNSLISSLESFRATRDASVSNVSVFSPASTASAVSTSPLRTAIIYGFIALLIFGGLLFAYEYVNDLARSPEEVEELVGAPILGTVQAFEQHTKDPELIMAAAPRSAAAEAYRLIRANLQFVNVDHRPHRILITSSLPGEGKSTTVSNLAQAFAEAGHSVALVDADLRRPSLHRVFSPNGKRLEGLTTLVAGHADMNGHGIQQTSVANLTLIASGPLPPRPADLLESQRVGQLFDHLDKSCTTVLIDSPPILAAADAAILSTRVDGVVLVVDPHRTKRREMRQAREAVEAVNGKIIGVVMNRLRPRGQLYYHYYGYYSYKYGYKQTYGAGESTPSPEPEETKSRESVSID